MIIIQNPQFPRSSRPGRLSFPEDDLSQTGTFLPSQILATARSVQFEDMFIEVFFELIRIIVRSMVNGIGQLLDGSLQGIPWLRFRR